MPLILCLAAILLAFLTEACPTDHLIPNLQVGSAFFSTSAKSKSNQITTASYQHTFDSTFSTSPAVALSLHSMGIEAVLTEWALCVDQVTPSKITVGFKHRPREWTMIKTGFWATTRNDIHMGSVSSNLNSLKQSTAFLNPPIRPTMTNLNTSIMRAFLTGFSLKSGNQLFIRAFDKTISPTKIEIGVQVAGSMEITSVVVNYLIFSPQASSFASYGGGASEVNLVEGKLLNIQKIIHYSPYVFHGIANIRQSLQSPIMILTEIDSNFYLKIDTLAQLQQVYISYLVLGIAPNKVCSGCKSNFIYNQQCIDSCPTGSYRVEYRNGGKGCRACPQQYNMVVNPTNNGCICQTGYIQKKGYCVYDASGTSFLNTDHFQSDSQIYNPEQLTVVTNSRAITEKLTSSTSDTTNKIVPTAYTVSAKTASSNIMPSQIVPDDRVVTTNNKVITSPANPRASNEISATATSKVTSTLQPAIQPTTSSGFIKKVSDLTIRPTPPSIQPETAKKVPQTSNIASNLPARPGLSDITRQQVTEIRQNTFSPADQKYQNPTAAPITPQVGEKIKPISYPGPEIPDSSWKPVPYQNTGIENSYIPSNPRDSSKSFVQIMGAINLQDKVIETSKDCLMLANSIWTGYKCSCKVGYVMDMGVCRPFKSGSGNPARPSEFIYKISSLYGNRTPQCSQNQAWNGLKCVCAEGCYRDSRGDCRREVPTYKDDNEATKAREQSNDEICPLFSIRVKRQCICLAGYTKIKGQCQAIQCGQNSYRSQGGCVCNNGYANISNKCVRKCGQYSSQDRWGQCQCDNGYKLYGGQCMQCPPNQMMIDGQCSFTCGVNQHFNPSINKCECLPSCGVYKGMCKDCPAPYFIHNGYCVDCPIFTIFDQLTGSCICQQMYQMVNGNCVSKCGQNERYVESTFSCICLAGLYRINKKCQTCPGGYNPTTQQCMGANECKENEIKVGNNCVCKQGFGYSLSQTCMKCDNLPNGFLVGGYCVVCPSNTQNINGQCACPRGQKLVNGVCINGCLPTQLMDEVGYCYYCKIGEEVANGACVCKKGYQRVNGVCLLTCPPHTFEMNGACGTCALGMEYDRVKKICTCPVGYYASSQGGCQVYIPPPIACEQSFFYSVAAKKCQPCQPGCKSCSNSNTCTKCALEGFQIWNGNCVTRCGDGIVVGNEECDDGNTQNKDGCSSRCKIQPGSTCSGSGPSRCTRPQPICGDMMVNDNEQCDDGNNVRGDGCNRCLVEPGWRCMMNQCTRVSLPPQPPTPTPNPPGPSCPAGVNLKLISDPIANQNNIFVLVETPTPFKFSNSVEMRQFMKYQFITPGTQPSSAYCIQRATNLKIFECLIIYASGVPNKIFNINFNYKYATQTGQLCVSVNPFNSFIKTRALK